jgi:hypothetical protein
MLEFFCGFVMNSKYVKYPQYQQFNIFGTKSLVEFEKIMNSIHEVINDTTQFSRRVTTAYSI